MRLLPCRGLSVVLLATALAGHSAAADELLVMPFSCAVVRGSPVLTPSPDQGHAVIGRREVRDFSACSPVDPQMCRAWTVFRFDLDCDGARVPWVDVAAAADVQRGGRSQVANGRFELRMPARWSLPPDGPCARILASEDRGRYNGLRSHCENRAARRGTVTMPAGFAPMLGIDGIFVPAGAPRSDPEADAQVSARRPPAEVVREKASAAPVPSKPTVKPPAEVASLQEPAAPTSPALDAPATGRAAAEAAPIVPQIINRDVAPGAAPWPAPADPRARDGEQAATAPSSASPDPASGEPPPTRDAGSSDLTPVAAVGSVNAAAVAIGGLTILALLTLAFVRRRGLPAAPFSRDLAAVSLGARAGQERGDDVHGRQPNLLAVVATPSAGREVRPLSTLSPAAPVPLGDGIPSTREEAMSVLGIGVAPDINEAAIKKIIDGLRLSWHPDHARDAADRMLRELRMRQINVAWDILADRRAG